MICRLEFFVLFFKKKEQIIKEINNIYLAIARYMLGIDIDYSNPNVQFNKGQGGIKESELLKVFPNPATDNLMLSFDKAIEGGFVIEVYNHTASKVLTETVSQTQAQYQLNTAKLKNGIYFISVRSNTETFKSKFTIIK